MGFYPKHLKVRRHRWNMRFIAIAALSGAMFQRRIEEHPTGRYNYNGDPTYSRRKVWGIVYSDDYVSRSYDTKSEAASVYLVWWFDKQGMWPKRSALTTKGR